MSGKSIFIKNVLGILLLFAGLFTAPLARARNEREAFFENIVPVERPGGRTFVFWVNGDADHFVKKSSSPDEADTNLYRKDQQDVREIEDYAKSCQTCDVVILHHQRGGARWYTTNEPWATYLRVFSRGREILERHIGIGNAADPSFLSGLLRLAEQSFPNQPMYLIYRGHSFVPEYSGDEKDSPVAPFAYSFPESSYGPKQFLFSLQEAGLKNPLQAVILAACRMADADMAFGLAPYARYLISSQVDILETLSTGFSFEFLQDSDSVHNEEEMIGRIARGLFSRFESSSDPRSHLDEALMEYPLTLVKLGGLEQFRFDWFWLSWYIRKNYSGSSKLHPIEKTLSSRYVENLRSSGMSQEKIERRILRIRMASIDPHQIDVMDVLSLLGNSDGSDAVRDAVERVIEGLKKRVTLHYSPSFSGKTGLNFEL